MKVQIPARIKGIKQNKNPPHGQQQTQQQIAMKTKKKDKKIIPLENPNSST